MQKWLRFNFACAWFVFAAASSAMGAEATPKIIHPGVPFIGVPSDAVDLLDGGDLSKWQKVDGSDAEWDFDDGVATATGTGDIQTRESYGDCQAHVEFSTPVEVKGEGESRGNSGIKLMGRYEVQILDSFENPTEPKRQCGAIFNQFAPLENACRKPGEWQTFEIVFHGPRFDSNGNVTRDATMTVLLNGILVQDHVTLGGKTGSDAESRYEAHPVKQPLLLQDHGSAVRFRNVWVRELAKEKS